MLMFHSCNFAKDIFLNSTLSLLQSDANLGLTLFKKIAEMLLQSKSTKNIEKSVMCQTH